MALADPVGVASVWGRVMDEEEKTDTVGPVKKMKRAAFTKYDGGKPRPALLPPHALTEVSKVLAFGAQKYAPGNWRNVDDRQRSSEALARQWLAYQRGEDIDPESGLPHLAHLCCSGLFLLESQLLNLGEDTRECKK